MAATGAQGGRELNEFASLLAGRQYGLRLPKADGPQIERYVAMHSGRDVSVERAPFRRQVDFWAFSIAAALAMELEPLSQPPSRWGTVFIYTSQGILDDDLSALLVIVAVAKLGHDSPAAGDAPQIVDLANRLAGAGSSVVLRMLAEDSLRTTPLDRVIELGRSLQERVRTDADG